MSYSPTTRLQAALDNILNSLNKLSFLSSLQTPTAELRANVNAGTLPTVTTVTGVTTVATVTNQTQPGTYLLGEQVRAQMNTAVACAIRNNITVS